MNNSTEGSLIDHTIDAVEHLAVEIIKFPIELLCKGIKALVNGVVDIVNPF